MAMKCAHFLTEDLFPHLNYSMAGSQEGYLPSIYQLIEIIVVTHRGYESIISQRPRTHAKSSPDIFMNFWRTEIRCDCIDP